MVGLTMDTEIKQVERMLATMTDEEIVDRLRDLTARAAASPVTDRRIDRELAAWLRVMCELAKVV